MKLSIRKSITLAITLLTVLCLQAVMAQSVITIATRENPQRNVQLQQIINQVNTNNTNYRLVHMPINGDFQAQLQTQVRSGIGADIFWVNQTDMPLALQDNFQSLNACMAHKPRYTVGDMSDYHSQIIETGVINHMMFGLPVKSSPFVIHINLDLFNRAGLATPTLYWNWDDFKQIASTLTKDTNGDDRIDQWGFLVDNKSPSQPFIWQTGSDVISGDLRSLAFNNPDALAGLDFYRSFSPTRQQLPQNSSAKQLFQEGKLAMFLGDATESFGASRNIAMQQIPRNPITNKSTTFAWTELLAVSRKVTNPVVCDAIQTLAEAIQKTSGASPRISHATTETYNALNPNKQATTDVVLNSMQQMRSPKIFDKQIEFEKVFEDNFINTLLNDTRGLSTVAIFEQVKTLLESHLR